jgi:cell division protein FtsI/penicillin-binding protein 2
MSNLPTYSPAKFNEVEDIAVFNNGIVSAPYEPGSDVKTLTMATGVDKGVVTPESTYYNVDYIKVEDRTIVNAAVGHTGEITFQTAMNYSLNTGFVTIAQRLGDGENINRTARNTIYDYFYNRFHLGQLTGVEVAGEVAGTVISPDETEGNAVRYSNMAFGQGMDVTMVQVAAAFSSVVNGGKYYKPTVIAGKVDKDGDYIENKIAEPQQIITKSAAERCRMLLEILFIVVLIKPATTWVAKLVHRRLLRTAYIRMTPRLPRIWAMVVARKLAGMS